MKAQLFVCGFLPGVTAAVLTTQVGLAAPLPSGNGEREKLISIPGVGFEIGKLGGRQKEFKLEQDQVIETKAIVATPAFVNDTSIWSSRNERGVPSIDSVGQPLTKLGRSQADGANVLINTSKRENVHLPGGGKFRRGKVGSRGGSTAKDLVEPVGVSIDGGCKSGVSWSCLSGVRKEKEQLAQNSNNPGGSANVSPATTRYQPNPNPLLFPTKPEEVRVKESRVITLAEALEIARRNNNDLQVALLQLEGAKAALREAQAGLWPTLNLNTSITRQQSASQQIQNQLTPEFLRQPGGDDPSTVFNSDLQLNYSLYSSGAGKARRREAQEQVRASELNVEQRSEEIRLNVTTQYYNLQQTDQAVRIATSAVANAQRSLEDAQALERAGVGTKFDVLRSQVNLANAQQQLTNAISSQQVEQRRFATLLNLPQTVTLRATDDVKIASLWERSLEETIILAFQNRPELQQQLIQREINEQRRRLALSQKGLQVSLLANYNLLDLFNDGVPVADGYSIGVRASLNLFDGGASRAQTEQSKINIAIAETNFASQRDRIRFEVEQFYAELQSNLKNVNTATTALEQAREALRLARLRFQAGVGTQTDVINSENDLTRAEGNRINAILDYNRALANLERAVTLRGRQNKQ